MAFDTDDLSKEVYEGILKTAEKLTHNLTLHYGLLSYECENEYEFLDKAKELTLEILEYVDDDLDELFFNEPPNKKKLHTTLKKILNNINAVKLIPYEKRNFEFLNL